MNLHVSYCPPPSPFKGFRNAVEQYLGSEQEKRRREFAGFDNNDLNALLQFVSGRSFKRLSRLGAVLTFAEGFFPPAVHATMAWSRQGGEAIATSGGGRGVWRG